MQRAVAFLLPAQNIVVGIIQFESRDLYDRVIFLEST